MDLTPPAIDVVRPEAPRQTAHHVRFTLSVSPAHVRGGLDALASPSIRRRLRALAPRIHDINFTHHIHPFTRDAHGVELTPLENEAHLRQMLDVQETLGITVTPVFNNIHVPNTADTLDQFVRSLRPLVERGIRCISVPHVLWMKMGALRRAFPDLTIKDTVLRRVRTGQDFWNHAEAGFDYVNLDRVLVRDLRTLREIKRARERFEERFGKRVTLSILDAEGCLGSCALWQEHYQHTMTAEGFDKTPDQNDAVFRYPQQYSCGAIGHPNLNFLLAVGLPYFESELREVCACIDVVKLAGRRSFLSLTDCLVRAETFGQIEGGLQRGTPTELRTAYEDPAARGAVEAWRRKTRNCRYQCWECSACTEVMAHMA